MIVRVVDNGAELDHRLRNSRSTANSDRRISGQPGARTSTGLSAQHRYAKRMRAAGFAFGLTVADAFVRGVRDIGYRSTGTALDELVDNAIQAEAKTVLVALNRDADSKRPAAIAVIDDGFGMSPTMCRLAAIWGGTHRESDRSGFGRYGYGLPSACVSQGRRFTIYSCQSGSAVHSVALDIDEIAQGRYTAPDGRIVVPRARRARLPEWVADHVQQYLPGGRLDQGTIILIEQLDRLTRTSAAGLQRHLVDHFGVIYRNWLAEISVKVQGVPVEPIDPLFLTPGARFYDIDDERPKALEPVEVPVPAADSDEIVGSVRVRYALFPPTFASVEKRRGAVGRNANQRFPIMSSHNGIVVLRMGRQIDVVTRGLGAPFQNNDRYWKVEIDFPPSLDEEFGITTSKQRIDVSSRIWDILRQAGVDKGINQLRRLNAEARSQVGPTESGYLSARPSELVMSAHVAASTQQGTWRTAHQPDWDDAPQPRPPARHAPVVPAEHVRPVLSKTYKVGVEAAPGSPFVRSEQSGHTLTLILNTAHPFFTELYGGRDTTYRLRNALEVMLFALLDTAPDGSVLSASTIARWSDRMSTTLTRLVTPADFPTGRPTRDADGIARTPTWRRREEILPC